MRCPAWACSTGWFCACSPRIRTGLLTPVSHRLSPTRTSPDSAVPVTTRPAPFTVKARSMARRKRWCSAWARAGRCCRWARRASIPRPSVATVTNSVASAKPYSCRVASTSSRTASTRASSTRSALVRATVSCGLPVSWRICRCSRVCAITPSSQATTSRAWSIPPTPASMLDKNFSCPGTSINPSTRPSGCGQ